MMRSVLVVIGLALWSVSADDKKDSELLQGTWTMASLEANGEKVEGELVDNARLVVKDERYTATLGDQTLSSKFKVDPSKSPKEIDFTYTDGELKGETVKGIYKLEGDTYTMCRALLPDGDRPAEFKTSADSNRILVVWKRQAK
jgi:uncharacterized protein (TIGR03067 family)